APCHERHAGDERAAADPKDGGSDGRASSRDIQSGIRIGYKRRVVHVAMAAGFARFMRDSIGLAMRRATRTVDGSDSLGAVAGWARPGENADHDDSPDRPPQPDPGTPAMARHATEVAGTTVRALGGPTRGTPAARADPTGPGPLRRDRLRRPGPVHHDGRPTRRSAPRPGPLRLPRDECPDVRASSGARSG